MKIVNSVTVAVTLSVFWSVASADAEIPGIRVVGQGVDGTLVLDDSVSDLATLSSPGLFMIGNETSEGAPTLLVIGHIEGFDAKTGILTVSGQRSTLSEHASVIDVPRDINSEINTDNLFWYLQQGRYVAVAGNTFGAGESLATHIIRLDNEVQPGSAPIYVRGSLDVVDDVQGIAYIGGMALNLNGATPGQHPATGNVVEVVAYQAAGGSALVTEYASLEAPSSRLSGSANLTGISGTGLKGISGTGLKGISGTGLKGISGTGLKGISGTGLKGISGTGLKGISGTGISSR